MIKKQVTIGKILIKQAVGIDVSHKKLDVSLGRMDSQTLTEVYAFKRFDNTILGHMALVLWVKKYTVSDVNLCFIMEATGVYHEILAHFLYEKEYEVIVEMPNKISNFFKTLAVKTVTDKSMSEAIALYGLEKNPSVWTKPNKEYRSLRQITRERDQLVGERTVIKNQMHAEEVEAYPCDQTIDRMNIRIAMLNRQIKEIEAEIAQKIEQNAEIKENVTLATSIPGIGLLSAAIILAETDGFALITNKRQLTSYAGLDVKLKDSGTSIHFKPRISKRGNKYLRKAMYFPALTAIQHNEKFKNTYIRIVSKTGIKMKGGVAIQRQLLELVYTICKTKKPYDKEYEQKQARVKQEAKLAIAQVV
jgi:transposase